MASGRGSGVVLLACLELRRRGSYRVVWPLKTQFCEEGKVGEKIIMIYLPNISSFARRES